VERRDALTQRGVVLAIHLLTGHGRFPSPVEAARALVGHGLEGDLHGKANPGSRRQVLLVDRRTLEAFGLPHGALREQLTVDFPDIERLPEGTVLQVGEATLEVTGPCTPCEVIGRLNAVADPAALQDALQGRRGVLSRVVAVAGRGMIRRGDAVGVAAEGDR
jgi:MOSC domain-containing protein YiiM